MCWVEPNACNNNNNNNNNNIGQDIRSIDVRKVFTAMKSHIEMVRVMTPYCGVVGAYQISTKHAASIFKLNTKVKAVYCWQHGFTVRKAITTLRNGESICYVTSTWCKDAVVGRAMAQAVSSQPLNAEARVRSRVSPRGICGGQSGTGTGLFPSTSVFPCRFHSTGAPLHGKHSSSSSQSCTISLKAAMRPYHLLRGPSPQKEDTVARIFWTSSN
jgi:predicted transcriptional regulator